MKRRTTQIAGGILFLLSLFVSSVSACACSHHESPEPAEQADCHSHSSAAEPKEKPSEDLIKPAISPGACCCIQSAPEAITKSEKIKSETNIAATSLPAVESVFHSRSIGESAILERPSFLTDSFHNLTPGRAPPRP